MKFKSIIIPVLIAITISCKKEKSELVGRYFGEITALKNNANWSTKYVSGLVNYPCFEGKLSVDFLTFNSEGFMRETMTLFNIPKEKGTFKISRVNPSNYCIDSSVQAFYATKLDDGDVLGDTYEVLPEQNFINIISYNPVTKEIKGSFQVSFIIVNRINPLAADTIRFRNANFKTKVFQ